MRRWLPLVVVAALLAGPFERAEPPAELVSSGAPLLGVADPNADVLAITESRRTVAAADFRAFPRSVQVSVGTVPRVVHREAVRAVRRAQIVPRHGARVPAGGDAPDPLS